MAKRIDELPAHPLTTGFPIHGGIQLPARDPDLSPQNTRQIRLDDLRGPTILVSDYGAAGDGATDDTAAIQAAIDHAHTLNEAGNGFNGAFIEFAPRPYKVTSTLDLRSGAWLRGTGPVPEQGTRLVWAGPAGGTLLQESAGMTFGLIEGLAFYARMDGSGNLVDRPGTYYRMAGRADWNFRIRHCVFWACSGDAIRFDGGYVNLHLRDLRFDGIGGYAIATTIPVAHYGSSFLLDGFTCDSRDQDEVPGIFLFDNETANSAGIGVVQIANARIELNTPLADPSGILVMKSASGGNWYWASVVLQNLFIQGAVNVTSAIHSTSAQAPCTYALMNVHSSGDLPLMGGWSSQVEAEDSGFYQLAINGAEHPVNLTDAWARFHTSYDSTRPILMSYFQNEQKERLRIDATGAVSRGPGANAEPMTKILRGIGSPEGVESAGVGSIYQREDGGPGTCLYVKESGTGNTGWVAK